MWQVCSTYNEVLINFGNYISLTEVVNKIYETEMDHHDETWAREEYPRLCSYLAKHNIHFMNSVLC